MKAYITEYNNLWEKEYKQYIYLNFLLPSGWCKQFMDTFIGATILYVRPGTSISLPEGLDIADIRYWLQTRYILYVEDMQDYDTGDSYTLLKGSKAAPRLLKLINSLHGELKQVGPITSSNNITDCEHQVELLHKMILGYKYPVTLM